MGERGACSAQCRPYPRCLFCCLLSCLFGVGRFCMFSSVSRVFLQRSNVGKKGARRFVTGLKHEDDFPVPFHPLPSPSMYKSPRIPSQDLAPDEKLKFFFENAMKKMYSYSNVCLWCKPSKQGLRSRWSASWFENSLPIKAMWKFEIMRSGRNPQIQDAQILKIWEIAKAWKSQNTKITFTKLPNRFIAPLGL